MSDETEICGGTPSPQPPAPPQSPAGRRLPADLSRWPTRMFVRGDDIWCPVGRATAFGGSGDSGDDGQTASGIRTDRPGGMIGCALPMPAARACRGTPLPQIPWKTIVRVSWGAHTISVPLIDEGPAGGLKSEAVIDLTMGAWRALCPNLPSDRNANNTSALVSFVIVGAARFLPDYRPANATA